LRLEGLDGRGLHGAGLARFDGSDVVVFAADGRAGKAAEHGELAGVAEGVGDGSLEEALDWRLDGMIGGQVLIEGAERGEKTVAALRARRGTRSCARRFALRHGERPVKEIAHVGEDLDGAAACAIEVGEGLRAFSMARVVR